MKKAANTLVFGFVLFWGLTSCHPFFWFLWAIFVGWWTIPIVIAGLFIAGNIDSVLDTVDRVFPYPGISEIDRMAVPNRDPDFIAALEEVEKICRLEA